MYWGENNALPKEQYLDLKQGRSTQILILVDSSEVTKYADKWNVVERNYVGFSEASELISPIFLLTCATLKTPPHKLATLSSQ